MEWRYLYKLFRRNLSHFTKLSYQDHSIRIELCAGNPGYGPWYFRPLRVCSGLVVDRTVCPDPPGNRPIGG